MLRFINLAAAVMLGTLLLTGCVSTPAIALHPGQVTPEQRRLQTRHYDQASESAMLAASLAVLQDLGFTLDGSESRLGVITASRQLTSRRPLKPREVARDLFWSVVVPQVGIPYLAYDAATGVKEPQVVHVSLVTSPGQAGVSGNWAVRITAQRLVYKDKKLTRLLKVEPLNDPGFYREFFTRLSQSVFLAGQTP